MLTLATVALIACAGLRPATKPAEPPQRVLLISLDGFRWDYIERPGAVRLRQLASVGIRAERLVPVFPSKTFPNHYTIVTGLYTDHHGIVANQMRDSVLGVFGMGDSPSVRDAR
jgi:predicted AlkP superfamily pyrophosphatase or phosphodiesterase